jgi:hypothetical protein
VLRGAASGEGLGSAEPGTPHCAHWGSHKGHGGGATREELFDKCEEPNTKQQKLHLCFLLDQERKLQALVKREQNGRVGRLNLGVLQIPRAFGT